MSLLKDTLSTKFSRLAKLTGLVGATVLMLSPATLSHAEPTGYNQIGFTAAAKAQVENDELIASMYTKAQATEPKLLASELSTTINQAMQIAKRYPSVKVTTGGQHTYPQYAKTDQKIIGWTGQANIEIKSTDIEAASRLIADLQDTLVMENLNFGVSESKRDIIEQQLMTQASRAFQAQANSLASAWDASGYRVVSVNLSSNGYYPQPPMIVSRMAVESSAAPMDFSSGDSTLTVTANGTIELVK